MSKRFFLFSTTTFSLSSHHHHVQAEHPVRTALQDSNDPITLRHPCSFHSRKFLQPSHSSSLFASSPNHLPQISLHSILSISNESYGQRTSVSNLFNDESGEKETPVDVGSFDPQLGKANAVFIMLCKNEEVDGAVKSIRELEDRFNHKYHYPWVFLNEVEFTDDFKKCVCAVPSRQSS
jgi:hypothetical protein